MYALVVTVPSAEVELASDALWSAGVVAIEERAAGADHGRGDEATELWTSLGEDPGDVETAAGAVLARWPWRLVEVDERVGQSWREFAPATLLCPCDSAAMVLAPEWMDAGEARSQTGADEATELVTVEPGETFGLGDHPTTRATAEALLDLVTPGCRVLDVGTGSGVLAIVAMRRGAAHAVGIDLHPACVPVTRHNASANGVEVEVSTTPLDAVEGEFDLVLANILAPTLIALSDDLKRVTAPGGRLVISGILADRHDHVLAALAPMTVESARVVDGWAAVVLRHPTGG
ncbi:MAG: 50S ribosomal protein L11 methyltransferase [Ilumatobacteraceae bacterium]